MKPIEAVCLFVSLILLLKFDHSKCVFYESEAELNPIIDNNEFYSANSNDLKTYQSQANELLNYLNSVPLNSYLKAHENRLTTLRNVINVIKLNKTRGLKSKNFVEVKALGNADKNSSFVPKNSTISALNETKINRLDAIIREINSSYKLDFKMKYNSQYKIHCVNCTQIQQQDECRDYVDYDFNELINIFCCQCNSELIDQKEFENNFKNVLGHKKENTRQRWFMILLITSLIGLLALVLIIVLSVCIHRYCKHHRQVKEMNAKLDAKQSHSADSSSASSSHRLNNNNSKNDDDKSSIASSSLNNSSSAAASSIIEVKQHQNFEAAKFKSSKLYDDDSNSENQSAKKTLKKYNNQKCLTSKNTNNNINNNNNNANFDLNSNDESIVYDDFVNNKLNTVQNSMIIGSAAAAPNQNYTKPTVSSSNHNYHKNCSHLPTQGQCLNAASMLKKTLNNKVKVLGKK